MSRDFLASMFRAIDARDWDALGRHFHPNIRYERPGFPVLEGRDAVLQFYREVRQIHGEHRAEGMAVDGTFGAQWGRFVGTKKDGTPVDVQYADTYVFADGLLKHRKSYFFVALGI
jgi:ketosteroid isomerase-like protein